MRTRYLSLFVLGFLAGCQDTSSTRSQSQQNDPVQSSESATQSASESYSIEKLGSKIKLKDDFSNLPSYIEHINSHVIQIKAASGTNPAGSVTCKKIVAGELDTSYFGNFNQAGISAELILPIAKHDKMETTFSCEIMDNKRKILKRLETKISKNIVISDQSTYPELNGLTIDTLVITKPGEILTEGSNFSLKVKKLISDEGKISTFTEQSVEITPADTAGRDGGRIALEVDEAKGSLSVNLRGTNAGVQTFVAVQPQRAQKGADGKCDNRRNVNSCDGQNGAPGLNAVDGKNGFDGGSTGVLNFFIAQKTDLELIVNYHRGIGSDGVPASLPGEGGAPGRPGTMTISDICVGVGTTSELDEKCLQVVTGRAGAAGPRGAVGVDGIKGYDGVLHESKYQNDEEGLTEIIKGNWSNLKGHL